MSKKNQKVETIGVQEAKRKLGPMGKKIKEFYKNQDDIIGTYFFPQSQSVKEDKKRCTMCNKDLPAGDFWTSYSYINSGRTDIDSKMHLPVCRTCSQKLFDYYYEKVHHKSYVKAMEHICCDLNLYWDIDIFNTCKEVYEKNQRKLHIMSEYIGALGRRGANFIGQTYWDSPTIVNRNITIVQGQNQDFEKKLINPEDNPELLKDGWDTPLDWEREDAENRKKIIRVYRYDPFEYETDEDKKALYRDLAAMLDDAMEDDFVKSRGALEVVRGFNRIEKLGKKIAILEKEETEATIVQKYVDMKTKERASITAYCKDNGFASSYGTKKSKGAGTLSGIMSEMNEKQYERGILNRFDVKTSESIQQAANASVRAIFDQLNIGGNEQYTIIQQQRDQLSSLQKKLNQVEEDLRKANCKIVELKLNKQLEESEDD